MTEVFGNRVDMRCQLVQVQKYFRRDKFLSIMAPAAAHGTSRLNVKCQPVIHGHLIRVGLL